MEPTEKDIVIEKIMKMPTEQVAKVLIFIAGLEAGEEIRERNGIEEGRVINVNN